MVLAAYCVFDSFRPARAELIASLPEPTWLYSVFFTVHLVSVVGVWIPLIPRAVSVVPVLLTPFALALGIAYLLRVVFPKAREEAARARREVAQETAGKGAVESRSEDKGAED